MKYRHPDLVAKIKEMYSFGRSPQTEDSYSKGKFTLRQISEKYNVPIPSVWKIVKNIKF